MNKFHIPFWKDAPFVRIIIPFIIGIAASYYLEMQIKTCLCFTVIFLSISLAYYLLRVELKFRFRFVSGIVVNLFILFAGATIAEVRNPFNNANLFKQTAGQAIYTVSLKEPLTERKSSWKALSSIESVQTSDTSYNCPADLLLYIKKDSNAILLSYGDRIAFQKRPERIKNFVDNSPFDYERYCALKNIHYQVFIKPSEIIPLQGKTGNDINEFLFRIQDWVVSVLHKNIRGTRECGLAEALLIGYKNDLDRSLIQSYSDTGVVHVVAISGLHLGLIYAILNMLCKPFQRKSLRPAIVLTGLWLFSMVAGASPSVLRSVVMFSSMVIGEAVNRRSSVINNLSVSAFFLLCYDPYWLWDLGFLLSYSALLSIVLFMKPIYHAYTSENRMIDTVWKLNAVTLSAQILTIPVMLYSFGQFPNLFIITNFLAIPLSGIILVGEIILCAAYFIEPVAKFCGNILTKLIRLMNEIVGYVDKLPNATTKNIHINMLQVVLLYILIVFASQWLINKHKSWQ